MRYSFCFPQPETPGCLVTRDRFEALWSNSVRLLQAGFATGSIITVDPAEKLPAPWTRRRASANAARFRK